MQIATTNTIAKFAAVVAGLGLIAMSFASFAAPAKAATDADLQAQISALLAQIASLQSQVGGSSTSAGTTFTTDLTLGSSGASVTALQNWLISKGFAIAAGATGYFGAQTQAALAKYQASVGISPAAGYFGPITRAKVNAAGGTGTGTGTGTDTDTDTDSDLQGGAGSVDTYTVISNINNEEVGEDEEDVEVGGLEIEADDGSDLEFTAVRLVFDEGTANQDFADYASEVSVWFDGEEVARLDADEFNDDNAWTKTVSLDGAILDAGETGELVVAVSGASNLDSADVGDTWTVDFRQVRFEDADGATVSEDPTTAVRTFSFATFATASDVELKFAEDDQAVNDARTIEVDATADTDNVEVLSFTMEAEGDSDLDIKNFGVSVTVTGASNTDDVLAGLSLWIDGEEIAQADTESTAGADEMYNFDDVDTTISAGDTAEVVIKADFLSIADALDEGDTIAFAIGENETDQTTVFDIEDEAGEDLADGDRTGSVSSGAFDLRSTGVMVTFISATETLSASDVAGNYDSGTFVIKYNVEAFGGTVYVSDSATATIATTIPDTTLTSAGVRYYVDQAGTPTVSDLSAIVTFSEAGGATDSGVTNGVAIGDGEDADFTLTVTRTNNADADDDGLYRVLLKAITWASTDASTQNVYDFNLEDFKTDPISIN